MRVCLAHLGLTKNIVPGLEEAFMTIATFLQVYFDTALVSSADVVGMALQIVGPNMIMYGSDEPLHLIHSVPYLHPQKASVLLRSILTIGLIQQITKHTRVWRSVSLMPIGKHFVPSRRPYQLSPKRNKDWLSKSSFTTMQRHSMASEKKP